MSQQVDGATGPPAAFGDEPELLPITSPWFQPPAAPSKHGAAAGTALRDRVSTNPPPVFTPPTHATEPVVPKNLFAGFVHPATLATAAEAPVEAAYDARATSAPVESDEGGAAAETVNGDDDGGDEPAEDAPFGLTGAAAAAAEGALPTIRKALFKCPLDRLPLLELVHAACTLEANAYMECAVCRENTLLREPFLFHPCDHVACSGCARGRIAYCGAKSILTCGCGDAVGSFAYLSPDDPEWADTVQAAVAATEVRCRRCDWAGVVAGAGKHTCDPRWLRQLQSGVDKVKSAVTAAGGKTAGPAVNAKVTEAVEALLAVNASASPVVEADHATLTAKLLDAVTHLSQARASTAATRRALAEAVLARDQNHDAALAELARAFVDEASLESAKSTVAKLRTVNPRNKQLKSLVDAIEKAQRAAPVKKPELSAKNPAAVVGSPSSKAPPSHATATASKASTTEQQQQQQQNANTSNNTRPGMRVYSDAEVKEWYAHVTRAYMVRELLVTLSACGTVGFYRDLQDNGVFPTQLRHANAADFADRCPQLEACLNRFLESVDWAGISVIEPPTLTMLKERYFGANGVQSIVSTIATVEVQQLLAAERFAHALTKTTFREEAYALTLLPAGAALSPAINLCDEDIDVPAAVEVALRPMTGR